MRQLIPATFALVLVFSAINSKVIAENQPLKTGNESTKAEDVFAFTLETKASLIRVGISPATVNEANRQAAQVVWDGIEKKEIGLLKQAIDLFGKLIPIDNFGGDYTALQWLCRDLIKKWSGEHPIYNTIEAGFVDFFETDENENLKQYLLLKYGVADFNPREMKIPTRKVDGQPSIRAKFDTTNPVAFKERRRQLEDFIMFMNPNRDSWESSSSILKLLGIKGGERIADIGCGFGFFTLKMADQVGRDGRVFAIDTDAEYTKRVMEFAAKEKLANITPVVSTPTDIKVSEPVDIAFIASLYHVIYGWSTEPDRKAFIESIKKSLKPDGRIVIVDNIAAGGAELHSCFVDHRLVAAQFYHYGFEVDLYAEVSPLRYVLVLKRRAPGTKQVTNPVTRGIEEIKDRNLIEVTSTNSIVHIGSLDSFDITEGGIAAAKMAIQALEGKNKDAALQAIRMYGQLIPNENFGGEFTAIQWFLEHWVSPKERQQEMLKNRLVAAYFEYLAGNDYELLKDYIKSKYKLLKPGEKSNLAEEIPMPPPPPSDSNLERNKGKSGKAVRPGQPPSDSSLDRKNGVLPESAGKKDRQLPRAPKTDARSQAIKPRDEAANPAVGKTQRTFLEDFILFNNPRRPLWENTEKIIQNLDIKPGTIVADIGSGSGYFTFRFANLTGPKGHVYAIDIKQPHLDFITEFAKKEQVGNVTSILARPEDISLNEKVDIAYTCSLYHIIYGVSSEEERRLLISSIKKAIKPGGQLVIVDNGPVEDKTLPYHGPYLAKELTISQLERYGFKFEFFDQIIPQRYMLKFRLIDP